MINALVFDVDGVLVEPMVFASILERDYGLTREKTAPFFRGPFEKCLLGQGNLRKELRPFLQDWKWPHTIEEFIRVWFEADSRLNEQVIRFANAMRGRGVPCYIASTQEHNRASYLESLPAFTQIFNADFFSCRLACQKPERVFYERIVSETGQAADGLLFFDDREANVVGVRKAGWNAELYDWGTDLSSPLSKYDVPYHCA